jgi:hypothetical protein
MQLVQHDGVLSRSYWPQVPASAEPPPAPLPPPVPEPPPAPPGSHAPSITLHAVPAGQVAGQPLAPHCPELGMHTRDCAPVTSTVSRQLSFAAHCALVVQVWPQKSLPAYCTQGAPVGQSLPVVHEVQVTPAEPPPPPLPAEHCPELQVSPVPQAVQLLPPWPQAVTEVPATHAPDESQQPVQLPAEQFEEHWQAPSVSAAANTKETTIEE